MTNEVEKKGEIYFKVAFPICYAILLSSLPGLLHAGVEKVQGGGRGGVHQGYVQSRWPTRKKRNCVNQIIFSACAAQTPIPLASGRKNTRCVGTTTDAATGVK